VTNRYKLRFDLQSRINLNWYYAEYSTFLVLAEQTNYTLRVSGFSGNAGVLDALSNQNGMMFTTYDRDNDPYLAFNYNHNCAVRNAGGFWYKHCAFCRVNGVGGFGHDFGWVNMPGGLLLQTSRMWLTCR